MARSRKKIDPRNTALDLLEAVLQEKRLLDDALDRHPSYAKLDDRDRAFARMLVSTTLRRLGQIDDLISRCLDKKLPRKAFRAKDVLRIGLAQLCFMNTPPHAAISTSVDLVKGTELAGFQKLINAVLRRVDREGKEWIASQDEAINIPKYLRESWIEAYGPELGASIAKATLEEAALDISVAGNPSQWADQLGAVLLPTGSLRLDQSSDITQLPGFTDGQWWVQDVAASLPAKMLGDVKGKRVADLCAAPGGKSLQLAAAGANVTSVDRSEKRLKRLAQNFKRLNYKAEIVTADVAAWAPTEKFDAILLDAPCSATGTLRRHPDGLHLKGPGDVAELADLQIVLMKAAWANLKPGGTMVYCVCSLEAAEGPDQIAKFLAQTPDASRKPLAPEEMDGMPEVITKDGDLRTLPCYLAHLGGMDAFFAARLTKAA